MIGFLRDKLILMPNFGKFDYCPQILEELKPRSDTSKSRLDPGPTIVNIHGTYFYTGRCMKLTNHYIQGYLLGKI